MLAHRGCLKPDNGKKSLSFGCGMFALCGVYILGCCWAGRQSLSCLYWHPKEKVCIEGKALFSS